MQKAEKKNQGRKSLEKSLQKMYNICVNIA